MSLKEDRQTHGEMESEIEIIIYKPRGAWDSQKLEVARKNPPIDASEEARLCQHIDVRLLDSRTVSQYTSVVLSHPVHGTLLRQP